jgi:NAD(P)-dependent dehydrogenase (short-subunit alcohol dehydrogenase family)
LAVAAHWPFAEDGAKVVVADILADQGRETVDLIESAGGEPIYVPAAVSRRSDVERLIKTAVDTFGRLDCAHTNAGSKVPPQRGQNSTTFPRRSGMTC